MSDFINEILKHDIFHARYKLPTHIVELVGVMAVLAISGARLTMPGLPRTRANTIGLGFAVKSLNFLLYQLLTEHMERFKKWKNLKAYAVINGLEIVFWGAVVFLLIQANIATCIGTGCTLSWVVVGLGIALNMLSTYAFGIALRAFREDREEKRLKAARTEFPMEPAQWSGSTNGYARK